MYVEIARAGDGYKIYKQWGHVQNVQARAMYKMYKHDIW